MGTSALEVSAAQARRLRLRSLQLATPVGADQVAPWFGAIQAQDYSSMCWSLGARDASATVVTVDDYLQTGAAVRTWPMRGTIHLVPGRDVRWMLESVGKRSLAGVQKRWDYLNLDRATVERSTSLLADALAGQRYLTRSQALQVLRDEGIDVSSQRGYHLLWYAAAVGVTCMGPMEGKDATFWSLESLAGPQAELSEDDAYVELARRYFRGHGPATVADFARWVGAPVGKCRKAVDALGAELSQLDVEGGAFLVSTDLLSDQAVDAPPAPVQLLPGFDEFVLGYKDRSLVLDPRYANAIVPGGNGVFRSTVVSDGRIVGVWSRTVKARQVEVRVEAFEELATSVIDEIDERLNEYSSFIAKPVQRVEGTP